MEKWILWALRAGMVLTAFYLLWAVLIILFAAWLVGFGPF